MIAATIPTPMPTVLSNQTRDCTIAERRSALVRPTSHDVEMSFRALTVLDLSRRPGELEALVAKTSRRTTRMIYDL